MLNAIMLSVTIYLFHAECRYAEYRYAKYRYVLYRYAHCQYRVSLCSLSI